MWNGLAATTLGESLNLNPHNPVMDCHCERGSMHSVIYLVGLVVVVLFILSLLGLH